MMPDVVRRFRDSLAQGLRKPHDRAQDLTHADKQPIPVLWGIMMAVSIVSVGLAIWVAFDIPVRPSDSTTALPEDSEEAVEQLTATVRLDNFPMVTEGHYVLWISDGTREIRAGEFRLSPSGSMTTVSGESLTSSAFTFSWDSDRSPNQAKITVEADGAEGAVSVGRDVVAGSFSGKEAPLRFQTLNVSGLKGSYILATPTTSDTGDETSGVWFFTPGDTLRSSLVLPDAPAGFAYEAWVQRGSRTLSLGRFSAVTGKDSFSGYSGESSSPAFPGEDLVKNPPEGVAFPWLLTEESMKVSVTLEPDIAGKDPTGASQFIPILEASIPADLESRVPAQLTSVGTPLPSGTVSLK